MASLRELDQLADQILRLTVRELAELNRLIRKYAGEEYDGVRLSWQPKPVRLPDADAEDRSVRGRTI